MAETPTRPADRSPSSSDRSGWSGTVLVPDHNRPDRVAAAFVLLVRKDRPAHRPPTCPRGSISGALLRVGHEHRPGSGVRVSPPHPGRRRLTALLTVVVVLMAGEPAGVVLVGNVRPGPRSVVFVHWLIFQSLYRIGALLPLLHDRLDRGIAAFAAATAHNVRTGRLPVPARLRGIASYSRSS